MASGLSIFVLLGGLLLVAIVVPLVLFARRSNDPAAERPAARSPLRWIAVAVLVLLSSGVLFVFVKLVNSSPRVVLYSNELTVDCQSDPDATIYFGKTAVGTGRVKKEILGVEEFCLPLNLQPTVADVEREVLASLPAGSKFIARPPNPLIFHDSEHAGRRLGVYRVERPDGSIDDMMLVVWHQPDRAFALPIRLRSGERFAIHASGGGGGASYGKRGLFGHEGFSEDHRRCYLRLKDREEGVTAWLDRFPEGATRLQE